MTISLPNVQKQNNTITLSTLEKYCNENITININVTKAVLTTASGSNSFDIEVPNGTDPNSRITFHFAVDANGNTTIT